jgi:hypothetical protein
MHLVMFTSLSLIFVSALTLFAFRETLGWRFGVAACCLGVSILFFVEAFRLGM